MLQRIQTVYLLLAAGVLGVFLGLHGVWEALPGSAEVTNVRLPAVVTQVAAGLVAAIALVAVFLYKNRALQARVIGVALVLDLLLALAMMAVVGAGALAPDVPVDGAFAVAASVALLPVGAYVFLHLARRSVRRDIELVRSMDRLR
jgi:hypothetical protein